MLYERWRRLCNERPRDWALHDVAAGRRWTFAELDAASESIDSDPARLAFPQGHSVVFLLTVIAAWRAGQVVHPLESHQPRPAIHARSLPAGIAHLKTTSASTGVAATIALTAEQLAADADNIVETMGLRPEWPNLGMISMAHSYGFSSLVTPLLLYGIPLVLVDSPLPESIRRAPLPGEGVTLPAVPALWRAWFEARVLPPNLRVAISAGAPLPLALEDEVYRQLGLKIHNFYGASECGGIAYDRTPVPRTDGAVAGTPMANVRLAIANDGCLKVSGAAVAEGYWPEPRDVLASGVFRTSDLADIVQGRILLRGRATDVVNVAGRKVSPETVERVLLQHPEVRDCLVFGAPGDDADRHEVIVAVVAARADLGETLRQFVLARLPAWQMPREWWFLDSLGVNERGKRSRPEWRQRWLNQRRREAAA